MKALTKPLLMTVYTEYRNAFHEAFHFDQDKVMIVNPERMTAVKRVMFRYGFLIHLCFGMDISEMEPRFDYNDPLIDRIEMTRLYVLCNGLLHKFQTMQQPYK
jgi:hypothetical protein